MSGAVPRPPARRRSSRTRAGRSASARAVAIESSRAAAIERSSRSGAADRPTARTRAPSRASANATARPSPREPPMTRAERPRNPVFGSSVLVGFMACATISGYRHKSIEGPGPMNDQRWEEVLRRLDKTFGNLEFDELEDEETHAGTESG